MLQIPKFFKQHLITIRIPKDALGKSGDIHHSWNENLAGLKDKIGQAKKGMAVHQITEIATLLNPEVDNSERSFSKGWSQYFDFISPILRDMIGFMDDDFKESAYKSLGHLSNYDNQIFLTELFKKEKNSLKRIEILAGLGCYRNKEVHRILLDHYHSNATSLTPDEFHYILKSLMGVRTNEVELMALHGLSAIHFLVSNAPYSFLAYSREISDKAIMDYLLTRLNDEKQAANFHIHLSQLRAVNRLSALPTPSEILKLYLKGCHLPENADIQNTTVKLLQSTNGLPFPNDFSKKSAFSEEDKLAFLNLVQKFYEDKESVDIHSRIFTQFLKSTIKKESEKVRRKTIEIISQLSITRKSTSILEILRVRKDDYSTEMLAHSMMTMNQNYRYGTFNESIVYFFKKCLKHPNQRIQIIAFEGLKQSPDLKILRQLANISHSHNSGLNERVSHLKENIEIVYQENRKKNNLSKPKPQKAWNYQQPVLSDKTLQVLSKLALLSLLSMPLFMEKCSG